MDPIRSVCFIDNSTVATCSKDECSVWSIGDQKPSIILDSPSDDKSLRCVEFTQTKSMKIVSCIGATAITLYNIMSGA